MKKLYIYAGLAVIVMFATFFAINAQIDKTYAELTNNSVETANTNTGAKVIAATTTTVTATSDATDSAEADTHTSSASTTKVVVSSKKVAVTPTIPFIQNAGVVAVTPVTPVTPVVPTTPTTPTTPTAPTVPAVPTTPTIPVPATNLVLNPSVEDSIANVPTGFVGDGYGTNDRAFTYENTGHTGSHSLKTTITTATGEGDAKWFFNPVAVTPGQTYKYSNWYKSSVATQLNVMVNLTDGTTAFYYLSAAPASADWTQANGTFTMPANAATATVFQVLTGVGFVQNDDFSLTAYVSTPLTRGLVSLTFDDGWRSIYENALPLLTKYNFTSTQYLLTSTVDYPDYMTTQMMQSLAAAGNEIAGHTVHHCDLTGTVTDDAAACPTPISPTQVGSELTGNKTDLQTITGAVVTDFATPYGAYNADVIAAIKAAGYESHRSTDAGFNSLDSFDPYNIKVQNMTNTTTVEQVQAWVDEAIANKTWLVIVYHEVTTSSPADATYAVTPANLDAQLAYIQQTGVAVVTVSQALDEIAPQAAAITTP